MSHATQCYDSCTSLQDPPYLFFTRHLQHRVAAWWRKKVHLERQIPLLCTSSVIYVLQRIHGSTHLELRGILFELAWLHCASTGVIDRLQTKACDYELGPSIPLRYL